ncbi:flavodoxin domain-containing protein [Rhodococcus chondri]|uniref:Flavodoxin domain-containing protein n=1 Tax=Rhodococcus chondri TaxID=3065941 RepID=A0ABU7JWR7_9NOCA|nr:flavodoxin domain-containing protein [Rhodococcus sp. CC-R104]MEE2033959.1 flavodoxin domain-containing protein [Rhodococcus sp. CC-R104]
MRILVSAASKHGSTAEIATALAAALRHHGAQVDVVPPDKVENVDGYDAVVLGSAIYRSRWLRAARGLADAHGDALRDRTVFLFSSGPVANRDRPVNSPYDVATVTERTGACEHRMFAGKLDPAVLGAGERMVVRMAGARTGDFRDWEAIGTWASKIVASLSDLSDEPVSPGRPDPRR